MLGIGQNFVVDRLMIFFYSVKKSPRLFLKSGLAKLSLKKQFIYYSVNLDFILLVFPGQSTNQQMKKLMQL